VWPYIISLFEIDGENGKIKMEKIASTIYLFLHPTYKN